MSKQYESADLILKLYDLRREHTMRNARDWFFTFNPCTIQEIIATVNGPHNAYYRMVTTYWDMAASLVNHGAIDERMFNDANMEHIAVFAKIEPFLAEMRSMSGSPQYLQNLEQLVMRIEDIEGRLSKIREGIKQMAAERAKNAEIGEQR